MVEVTAVGHGSSTQLTSEEASELSALRPGGQGSVCHQFLSPVGRVGPESVHSPALVNCACEQA